jgi:hypothetical protein
VLKEKTLPNENTVSNKIVLQNKGNSKTFPDKQKLSLLILDLANKKW